MAIATLNGIVVQVFESFFSKAESGSLRVRLSFEKGLVREFVFEYRDQDLHLKEGIASDREKSMIIHCIQALELSDPDVKRSSNH